MHAHVNARPRHAGKGGEMRMALERTYIMAKPDALQRGIVSDIISRFGALFVYRG